MDGCDNFNDQRTPQQTACHPLSHKHARKHTYLATHKSIPLSLPQPIHPQPPRADNIPPLPLPISARCHRLHTPGLTRQLRPRHQRIRHHSQLAPPSCSCPYFPQPPIPAPFAHPGLEPPPLTTLASPKPRPHPHSLHPSIPGRPCSPAPKHTPAQRPHPPSHRPPLHHAREVLGAPAPLRCGLALPCLLCVCVCVCVCLCVCVCVCVWMCLEAERGWGATEERERKGESQKERETG